MKAVSGKDPTQRFQTCSAFAAAVRVGLAGGTVEVPADPNAGLAETMLLEPHVASSGDDGRCRDSRHRWAPSSESRQRRVDCSRQWRTAVAAANVLAALGVWTWLVPPEPTEGPWWALRERAGRTWVALRGGVGTTTLGPTPVPVWVSGTRISGTGESRLQPTGSEHLGRSVHDLGLVARALVAIERDAGQEAPTSVPKRWHGSRARSTSRLGSRCQRSGRLKACEPLSGSRSRARRTMCSGQT